MKGNIGFTPILEKLGAAVTRASRANPSKGKSGPAVRMNRTHALTDQERYEFHALTGEAIGGRYAIKRIPGERNYEIWDAESSAVFGPYRTYSDAAVAAERLP